MKQKRLDPSWQWTRKYGFAPGIRTGDIIHTCGVVAYGLDGELVGIGDCYAQAKRVYEAIGEVLAIEGCCMADIVKTTTWLSDMSNYDGYARARAETFPHGIPCSTTVESALVLPEFLIEIEAVAVIGSSAGE